MVLRAVSGAGNAVKVLYNIAYPFIVPSSGSVAANGTITLTTALDATYSACYMYFPAGVYTGSTAGFYYVAMSNTTTGQMYTDKYSSGVPTTPSSPTAVTTGAGAYTQTTAADFTALVLNIPGGSIGLDGCLRMEEANSFVNTAGTKTTRMAYGGTTIATVTAASTAALIHSCGIMNREATNSQFGFAFGQGTSTHQNSELAVDSTSNQNLTTIYRLAVATDWIVCRTFQVLLSNP